MPLPETPDPLVDITSALSDDQPHKKLSESIDVVGGAGTTPNVSLILPPSFLPWHLVGMVKHQTGVQILLLPCGFFQLNMSYIRAASWENQQSA